MNAILRSGALAALCLSAAAAPLQAQRAPRCEHALPNTLVLYGPEYDVARFPLDSLRRAPVVVELTVPGHHEATTTYRGVPLAELLRQVGALGTERLRGAALEQYLVAEAADGYRAVLALAEADTSYQATTILVAFEANGAPLDERTGPLQLVVESDREHGRWVRQVECVRIERHR